MNGSFDSECVAAGLVLRGRRRDISPAVRHSSLLGIAVVWAPLNGPKLLLFSLHEEVAYHLFF
jgi:hypothetical protein